MESVGFTFIKTYLISNAIARLPFFGGTTTCLANNNPPISITGFVTVDGGSYVLVDLGQT